MGPSREGSRREAGMQKSSSGKFLDNLGFSLLDSRMVRSSFHGPMKAGDWSTFARDYGGLSWFLETSGDVNPVLPGALYPPRAPQLSRLCSSSRYFPLALILKL